MWLMAGSSFLKAGEANQVGAHTEASALAGRHGDRGGESVQQGEGGEGGRADRQNLAKVRLLGIHYEDGYKRNHKALNCVLQ